MKRHVKLYEDFLPEMAQLIKQGKTLWTEDGLPVKAVSDKALESNVTFFYNEKANFVFPAGKFFIYFHQDGWKKLYDEGKAGMLIFNPARGSISQFGKSPITDIWKKSYGKKIENSDMIYGVTEGQVVDGNAYVEMMSVRPGYKRNSINRRMIDALKSEHNQIVWDEPTEDGLKFIKSYSGDDAKFFFPKNTLARPKNWKKLYPDGEERLVKP